MESYKRKTICFIIAIFQRALKLCKLRNLTLEGKVSIFKILALSKTVFQALVTSIPIYVIIEVAKIQKSFLWEKSTLKI